MRRNLDGFTHSGGLESNFTLARLPKVSSRLPRLPSGVAVGIAIVFAFGICLSAQPDTTLAAISDSNHASAEDIPRLFTPLPQAASKGSLPQGVSSMERVSLNSEVLGFSAITLTVEGRDLVAERVDSERRASSEMFVYRAEGESLFSTFTKSYNGLVLGRIWANGKAYFASGDGDNYLVVSNDPVLLPEVVHYPILMEPISSKSVFVTATLGGRRRAVRSGSPPPTVFVNIAICLDYRDAVGSAEKAIFRATHMIDRQNVAYRSSGFYGRMAIREIVFIDPPKEVIAEGLWAWAVNSEGPVAQHRRRTKAAGTVVLADGIHRRRATRTAPSPINPDIEVAVSGSFFAEWDDGDIIGTMHEIGHLSGGDHNPESAERPPDDPQITARDWYSCEEEIYGLLSYNVCNKFLKRVEMYSGMNAVYAGRVRGNEMQNNVGMFARVFEFMKGDHD